MLLPGETGPCTLIRQYAERVNDMKKWFLNVEISKKLSTGFLIVTLLGILTGLVGIINMVNIKKDQQEAYNKGTLGIEYAAKAHNAFLNLRSNLRDVYIYNETGDRDKYLDTAAAQLETVQKQMDVYKAMIYDSEDEKNYEALQTAYKACKDDMNETIETARAGVSSAKIMERIKSGSQLVVNVENAFNTLDQYGDALAADRVKRDNATTLAAIFIMLAMIVLSYILSRLLSRFISGIISDPVQKFAAFGELIAVGDIEVEKVIDEKDRLLSLRKDEIGRLAGAYDRLIESTIRMSRETERVASGDLTTEVTVRSEQDVIGIAVNKLGREYNQLISSILKSAEQISAGSAQISNGAQSLAQGATEQASSIQELSATISDTSQHVKENAENARKADKLSAEATAIVNEGISNMELAEKAMQDISATSKDIGKVIKAIDDIAFQTNILALNAAVEAARAGAAGKGFAVVADEVRNLSQKSAEAAKNTTSLIESSIEAVENGTELVNKSGASFAAVAEKSAEVGRTVQDISSRSQEQADNISQLSISIEQVSSVVQMNSATAEESAAACEELSGQANYLLKSVSGFKISDDA